MSEYEFSPDVAAAMSSAGEQRVPILQEEARITKRVADVEHVTVRTAPVEEQVVLRDDLRREHVEVTRVPVNREEGDVTVIPILEERAVVEKRLFLVEELHLKRTTSIEQVEIPTTLRRTHVEINREQVKQEEY